MLSPHVFRVIHNRLLACLLGDMHQIGLGNLPHTDSSEEEERRLMYVGMTRAKNRLILSSAMDEGFESRFLEEAGLV